MKYLLHFCALMSAPTSAILAELKCNLKCNLISATPNAPSYVSLCRLLSASLGAALMYPQMHSQLHWQVDYQLFMQFYVLPGMKSKMRLQVQHRAVSTFTEPCCTLLCIDNCINKRNSSAAWSAPFTIISSALFCASLHRSWSAALGAIPGVSSGAP